MGAPSLSVTFTSASRPDRRPRYFLAEDAPGADALYVLGICSNSGLGRRPNPLHREVADAAASPLSRPWCLYFIHGNRDFILGRQFAKRANMTVLGDPCVIELLRRAGAAEPRGSALHPG